MSLEAKQLVSGLPSIGGFPTLPRVGTALGQATAFVGSQYAGAPQMQTLLHLKSLKYEFEQLIQTLVEGYVPAAARQPKWAARVADYTQFVAQITATMSAIAEAVIGEAQKGIDAANTKRSSIAAEVAALQNIPAAARSRIENHLLSRKSEYVGELDAQIGRLQNVIASVLS